MRKGYAKKKNFVEVLKLPLSGLCAFLVFFAILFEKPWYRKAREGYAKEKKKKENARLEKNHI